MLRHSVTLGKAGKEKGPSTVLHTNCQCLKKTGVHIWRKVYEPLHTAMSTEDWCLVHIRRKTETESATTMHSLVPALGGIYPPSLPPQLSIATKEPTIATKSAPHLIPASTPYIANPTVTMQHHTQRNASTHLQSATLKILQCHQNTHGQPT